MQSLTLLLLLPIFATACKFQGQKRANGETWVIRSHFFMRCTINSNGSWRTEVTGCRTESGKEVPIGSNVKDADTMYHCNTETDGKVLMTKEVVPTVACDGHKIGESWTANKNFFKTCTSKGAKIVNCLTDDGKKVELNGKLVNGGDIYSCVQSADGKVTIHKEGSPSQKKIIPSVKDNEVKTTEKAIIKIEEEATQGAPTEQQQVVSPASVLVEQPFTQKSMEIHAPSIAPPHITCNDNGTVRKSEESWIAENKFTKKCSASGEIIILNCLLDENTTINVDSEVKIGEKIHKCFRKGESVFYEMKEEKKRRV